MAGKLFGTDGARGLAGEFLTAELATALGRAAAAISPAEAPQVLIVRDTRESGEMLEAALAAGVAAGGGHALLGGVLTTPGAKVLLDCANGATHRVAPEIFRRLGAQVDAVAVEPDGRNINRDCGSTHVE